MQLINSIIFSVLFTLCACASTRTVEDCKKCSVEISVMAINENNINEQTIQKLFCTAEDSCRINAEFMELVNEALFLCLEKKSEMFIKQFSLSSKQEFILSQLESPISDTINLQKIIENFAKIPRKKNTDSYNKILHALNLAAKKMQ